jgi:cell division protein ZapA
MKAVTVFVNEHEYRIACEESEEPRLMELVDEIDQRVRILSEQMGGRGSESTFMLLVSLMLLDELQENSRKLEEMRTMLDKQERQEFSKIAEMQVAISDTFERIADRIEYMARDIENRA